MEAWSEVGVECRASQGYRVTSNEFSGDRCSPRPCYERGSVSTFAQTYALLPEWREEERGGGGEGMRGNGGMWKGR
ncbi:hypothetical protein E2C01_000713 [Portunus trituberculatus]|uniref:Uncharacterized protein n=1 Tax=Portunus trituberculatus TaxID=210409 RepID=A0A5B7CFD4_PORTR|nr:hypothetical protein [Portunus trituberculatus]